MIVPLAFELKPCKKSDEDEKLLSPPQRKTMLGQTNRISVDLAGIATAVPVHKVSQEQVADRARTLFPQYARLEGLHSNSGIETRYACKPRDWYLEPRTWEERTSVFYEHALPLLEDVALRSVEAAGLKLQDIDVIVTNTITGLAVPSLDARLMNRLAFRADVERLPIFGFGCGGGVAGLARAAKLASAKAGQNVLFLTVDLCSLCLRTTDPSLAMFVCTALFGDGAVGVVLRSSEDESKEQTEQSLARVVSSGEHFWPETEHIMGWDIKNDGFGVVLSPELPTLMRTKLADALQGFLDREGLDLRDFDGFLFHPGGQKVIAAAEAILGLSDGELKYSRDVLRNYGNMSSATALFVMQEAIRKKAKGRHLLAAFGPGFSAYFMVIDI